MNIEQHKFTNAIRPISDATTVRHASLAAAAVQDNMSASAAGQRDTSKATASYHLPALDWPVNLFA